MRWSRDVVSDFGGMFREPKRGRQEHLNHGTMPPEMQIRLFPIGPHRVDNRKHQRAYSAILVDD